MKIAVLAVLLFPALITATPLVKWPTAYTAIGRIMLPYADVVEPFNVSINGDEDKAFYSFYSGVANIYYLGKEGKYGTMYKKVYVTMNNTYNVPTCFGVPGEIDAPVTVQSILPNITAYSFSTNTSVNGEECMVFVSSFTENKRKNQYSLFVRKSDHSPYLLSFTGYDRLLGSHYDEYEIYYDHFIAKAPSDNIFTVPDVKKCTGFPGPGDTHLSDNLFHELIGSGEKPSTDHIDKHFDNFKHKYNREYLDDKEHALRKKHFHQNFRFIHSTNRQQLTYKVAINHLADLTNEERKTMRGYKNTGMNSKFIYKPSLTSLPIQVNWRILGAVTPVKDQGICGSCWSFGTTGTLEGSLFLKTGKRVSLSEQAFMDCSWGQGNNACDGGESERAYEWMLKNGCLPTEESYGQYMMQDGKCHAKTAECGVNITQYFNTKSGDVQDLRAAIAENGPISVAIDASLRSFSFYDHGVYYDKDCGNGVDDLDHQVLAVGYGSESGRTYWLVKNSWSTHWGTNGYVLMSDQGNNCGVATDASFAKVT